MNLNVDSAFLNVLAFIIITSTFYVDFTNAETLQALSLGVLIWILDEIRHPYPIAMSDDDIDEINNQGEG